MSESLHEMLDRHSQRLGRITTLGILREDWRRFTDLAHLGEHWDAIGFDLWLERLQEISRELKSASVEMSLAPPKFDKRSWMKTYMVDYRKRQKKARVKQVET